MSQSLQRQEQVTLASLDWSHDVGTVGEVVYISVFQQTERWMCQYLSAYIAAATLWLR